MMPPSVTPGSRESESSAPSGSNVVREAPVGPGAPVAEMASVVRGLAAIFWGLPIALLAFARHFLAFWPSVYDLVLPPAATGLLLLGLHRLSRLYPQERIWQQAVFQAQILALLLVGLSPFLFFWSRTPGADFFGRAVVVLLGAAFAFVVALMRVLVRLSAILPDETARSDARLFQGLATYVVVVLVGAAVTLFVRLSPIGLSEFLELPKQPSAFGRQALLLLLTLLPIAMAMAVAWKLKEVAMGVVIGRRR
ncbi:MAG: hypothetical protein JNK85_20145 [Verrucomicrobiales bacterium]|nr:hypothetical protein [Verrucomicrobiales bacterium]